MPDVVLVLAVAVLLADGWMWYAVVGMSWLGVLAGVKVTWLVWPVPMEPYPGDVAYVMLLVVASLAVARVLLPDRLGRAGARLRAAGRHGILHSRSVSNGR